MLPGKVEICSVGEAITGEIGFVDILHEEITVTVRTDENRHDCGDEEYGYGEGNKMSRDELGHIRLDYEWAIDGDVLINKYTEEGEREDESYDIRIEVGEDFGNIPVDKMTVKEEDILTDLFEITEVGCEHKKRD